MIISASRRTDIPAFHTEWFTKAIERGSVSIKNPYSGIHFEVDLKPEKVDAFVFWTKNPAPFIDCLKKLNSLGYGYCFLFTVNGYPKILEPNVPSVEESLDTFKRVSEIIGSPKMVWRFDPVVITDMTPENYIIDNFERIASELKGYTQRVIFSIVDLTYKKVAASMSYMRQTRGINYFDLNDNMTATGRIVASLANSAKINNMELQSCAIPYDYSAFGVKQGKCIDAEFLKKALAIEVKSSRDRNQRKHCFCDKSRDIGSYNTCYHGCVYCYAVNGRVNSKCRQIPSRQP